MPYITPDRSNRPSSSPQPDIREVTLPASIHCVLEDGRPIIKEDSLVEGYHCVYYYFDRRGIELHSFEELRAMLAAARVSWPNRQDGNKVYMSSKKTKDAQGRPIWEVSVTFPPLD